MVTTWVFEPGHTSAEFRARHMMVTWVRGLFKDIRGTVEFDRERPMGTSFEGRIDATRIWTGESDRDAHLRSADFFDVETYPEITFRSTRAAAGKRDGEYVLWGDLTIKGVTREVELGLVYTGSAVDPWGGSRVGFEGETTVNRKDFGLTWNAALETGGVLVSDKVKLEFDISAIKSA